MIINVLEIQLQTVFYPGYNKRNITSVQAPVLGKKNLLTDKSDNNVASLAKFDNRCSTVWARRQDQWEGNDYGLSFRRMRKKVYAIFLQRIFGRDFLSPRTTIFSGIENYPSASISCCSDDLAQLLPCLDL